MSSARVVFFLPLVEVFAAHSHSGDVFTRKGIGGVADQQTGLSHSPEEEEKRGHIYQTGPYMHKWSSHVCTECVDQSIMSDMPGGGVCGQATTPLLWAAHTLAQIHVARGHSGPL